MSHIDYGLDGNLPAEAILGLGGEIVFGGADEALRSVDATDAFRLTTKLGGAAVAVTVESVDIIDAVNQGDIAGAVVETGGLAGALGAALTLGSLTSRAGPIPGLAGAAVGAFIGESAAEDLVGQILDNNPFKGENENSHLPNVEGNTTVITARTKSGDQISYHDDPVTGLRVATSVEVNSDTGEQTAGTTRVIANNDPNNPAGDLLVGNIYEAGNVAVGQEISVLDQLAGTHNGNDIIPSDPDYTPYAPTQNDWQFSAPRITNRTSDWDEDYSPPEGQSWTPHRVLVRDRGRRPVEVEPGSLIRMGRRDGRGQRFARTVIEELVAF